MTSKGKNLCRQCKEVVWNCDNGCNEILMKELTKDSLDLREFLKPNDILYQFYGGLGNGNKPGKYVVENVGKYWIVVKNEEKKPLFFQVFDWHNDYVYQIINMIKNWKCG